mmetsp:Transcript_13895/g.33275  ORF Transcript_13895/g.33275 Transcript_13895/m.33275 type:complete len:224 (+) Transcript_13895:92-763(+)
MWAFFYTCIFVVGAWLPLVVCHWRLHGVVNWLQVALTLFNAVNLMICLWENALFLHRDHIRATYEGFKKKFGNRRFPTPVCFFEDITLGQALSYKYWSIIWSTYSLLDPSYSSQTSFGFWIDTGNGITTLLPTALLSVAVTWDVTAWVSVRALGVVGLVVNYQMLYGTVLYFSNYCLNGYYKKTAWEYVAMVCVANGIWVFFPGAWMWACWDMIMTDSLQLFR